MHSGVYVNAASICHNVRSMHERMCVHVHWKNEKGQTTHNNQVGLQELRLRYGLICSIGATMYITLNEC